MRRTAPLRIASTWALLVGALALALAFVGLRALTPSDGARIAFYGDGWSDIGVRIAPIDAPAAGLQDGDLVVAVDGRSVDGWLGALGDPSVARPPAGQPMPYRVIRDDVPVATAVSWEAPPVGATLLAGWSVILFSVAVAVVAAFVFARRPNEPVATALMIAAAAAAGSSVPWFLGTTVSEIVTGPQFVLHTVITGPLYMLLWPAGIHFALAFPTPSPILTRRRWLVPSVYAVALGAYALALAAGRLATSTELAWLGTWPLAQVVVVVPALAVSLVLLIRSFRRTTDPAAVARIRWAWLGMVAAITFGLAAFWIPELVLGRPLLPESWLGLAALPLPLGLAAGILRDRLFDIDVVVRRTFVYGGLTLGVVASYVAVASAITAVVGTDHGFGATLLATGAAALVALPLRDGLQRVVNRFLYGDRDEPWRAMRRLGQRLDLAADPDRLFPVIVETVGDALRVPYARLEVIGGDGRFVTVAERGRDVADLTAVPISDGHDRVGTLVLGARTGEHGFRPDEVELLTDLARQAGAAIHARQLQADLARSHERLLLAREEERRRLRHDLHDGLGPTLAAIRMRAEASAELLAADPDAARRQLDELDADVQVALVDLRRLVEGLRPPALDDLGLIGAIAGQAARLEGSSSDGRMIAITVEGAPDPLPDLPAAVEVAAYRIAVEAMTNAVRHAGARSCAVRVVADGRLAVVVTDDGRGMPSQVTPGTGLESMAARATELGGALTIDRPRGGGTRLEAWLPLSVGSAPAADPSPGVAEAAPS